MAEKVLQEAAVTPLNWRGTADPHMGGKGGTSSGTSGEAALLLLCERLE